MAAVTYEQVLELINNISLQMQETDRKMRETDRKMQETDRKFERIQQENAEQTRELKAAQKRTQQEIGNLCGSLGNFVAEMVNGNVIDEFNKLGYPVGSSTQKYKYWDDDRKNILAEADLILLNGDTAVIVEVKLTAEIKDIRHFIKQLDVIKTRPDRITAGLKLIGAIAGGVIDGSVVRFAQKNGLYVIRQNDDTFEIVSPPEDFKAKVW